MAVLYRLCGTHKFAGSSKEFLVTTCLGLKAWERVLQLFLVPNLGHITCLSFSSDKKDLEVSTLTKVSGSFYTLKFSLLPSSFSL